MPTIDSFRFVNLNFDSDKAHIQDITIEVESKESLWLIRNGGGKSVISQISMQPYVFGHDRHFKNRPFKSYLPLSKPLYVLHQYKLDDDAGYLIVGFLVIRVKSDDENNNDDESSGNDQVIITNVIRKFSARINLNTIPFFYKTDTDAVKLRNYDYMVKYFSDNGYGTYPISNSDKKKEYIRELANYKIDTTEWKEIIREANLDESGLSKFFEQDSKASDIVRRIFLPKIQVKLSEHELKIEDIAGTIYDYFLAVENNEENLSNQQVYREFMIESEELGKEIGDYINLLDQQQAAEDNLSYYHVYVKSHKEALDREIISLSEELNEVNNMRNSLKYEEASLSYYIKNEELQDADKECKRLEDISNKNNLNIEKLTRQKHLLKCAEMYCKIQNSQKEVDIAKASKATLENGEDVARIKRYRYTLKNKYEELLDTYEYEKDSLKKENDHTIKSRDSLVRDRNVHVERLVDLKSKFEHAEEIKNSFAKKCIQFAEDYSDFKPRETIFGFERDYFIVYEINIKNSSDSLARELQKVEATKKKLQELDRELTENIKNKNEEISSKQSIYEGLLSKNEQFNKDKNEINELIDKYGLDVNMLYNKEAILNRIKEEELILKRNLEATLVKLNELKTEINNLRSNTTLTLPGNFKGKLNELGIEYVTGFEWLKENPNLDELEKINMIKKNKLLPYSLVFDESKDIGTILDLDINIPFPIPLMDIKNIFKEKEQLTQVLFYSKFNTELLDENKLEAKIVELENCCDKLDGEYQSITDSIREINSHQDIVDKFNYDVLYEINLINEIKAMEADIAKAKEERESFYSQIENNAKALGDYDSEINRIQQEINDNIKQVEAYKHITGILDEYYNSLEASKQHKNDIDIEEDYIAEIDNKFELIVKSIDLLNKKIPDLESKIEKIDKLYAAVEDAEEAEEINSDKEVDVIQGIFNIITSKVGDELKEISDRITQLKTSIKEKQKKLDKYIEKNIVKEEYRNIKYSHELMEEVEEQLDSIREEQQNVMDEFSSKKESLGGLKTSVKGLYKSIKDNFAPEPMAKEKIIINRDFDKDIKDCDILYNSIEAERNAKLREYDIYKGEVTATEQYAKDIKFINLTMMNINNQDLKQYRLNLFKTKNDLSEKVFKTKDELYNFKIKDFCKSFINKKPVFEEVLYEFTDHTIDPMLLHGKLLERRHIIETLLDNINTSLSELKNDEEIIIEHLYNYIRRLYTELGEIDKGSYITIAGEGKKKMLQISIKNDINYLSKEMVRLQILNEVVLGSKVKRSESKDVNEYIKTFMKAENLFDRTYGIDNIDIKLYKLTERGSSIQNFEEAKANSGGEGSFTAFVILSCVMTYFRKNSINTKDNWKLMLLDNPFAKMTSPHLLIPLFDLAKKLQVQLICLSDIDTEGVKDRFDNIHVFMHVPVEGREKETLLIDVSDQEVHQQLQDNPFAYKYEKVDQISMLV